jgi:hypothetical protein
MSASMCSQPGPDLSRRLELRCALMPGVVGRQPQSAAS